MPETRQEPDGGAAALFEAVRAGDADRVASLLRAQPALSAARVPETGETALHLAVDVDAPPVADVLIASGMELDARSDYGRTALHDAIEYGRETILRRLIDAGADVDVCAAAILGNLDRLEKLLGTDPRLTNERSTGMSPLCWAAFGTSLEAAELLLGRGARLDDGELLCAASVGRVPMGRVLLRHGADPDETHPGAGRNALHAAAEMRYTSDGSSFVRLLLEHDANPRLSMASGKTALELAREGLARQSAPAYTGRERNWAGVIALLEEAESAAV